MDTVRYRMGELTRAVAEGRLALAEVAAISADELDAIYEAAVMRLDVGRPADAARMLAALVILYPFAAEYWRAYAVALNELGEQVAARRAYAMAQSLAPTAAATLARELLGAQGASEPTQPYVQGQPEITATDIGAVSLVEPTLTGVDRVSEVTEPRVAGFATAAMPAWPVAEEPTQPRHTRRETTATGSTSLPVERSVTAIVDRRPRHLDAHGDTARIDRRRRRRLTLGASTFDDDITAIVRRRNGLPLGEDV